MQTKIYIRVFIFAGIIYCALEREAMRKLPATSSTSFDAVLKKFSGIKAKNYDQLFDGSNGAIAEKHGEYRQLLSKMMQFYKFAPGQ